MRTLYGTADEFVRCHRLLTDRTGNDPNRLIGLFDEFPDLAGCMARLHEIDQEMQRHRNFGERPFIVSDHPDFGSALKDFRERWTSIYSGVRAQIWRKAALLVASEFMRCYRLLIGRTADNPNAIEGLGERRRELAYAFGVLDAIYGAFSDPDEYGKAIPQLNATARELNRLLADVSPQFHAAAGDFGLRWRGHFSQLVEKDRELGGLIEVGDRQYPDYLGLPGQGTLRRTGPMPLWLKDAPPSEKQLRALRNWSPALESYTYGRDWLGSFLDSLPAPSVDDPTRFRAFDPTRDSAAEAVTYAERLFEQTQLDEFEYPVGEAFEWIHETKKLNLHGIERRMKEFPDIIVPQHVLGQSELEAPRGLYATLAQIRLAYVIGADLAAISLCRSVTERLIRFHYAQGIPYAKDSRKTKLTGKDSLIERVEQREAFSFLRHFNLSKRVKQAHAILHIDEGADDIRHRDRDGELVSGWLRVLQEMIDRAPPDTAIDVQQ